MNTILINSRPQQVPKTGVVISTVISTTVTKLHCKNNEHASAISQSNNVDENLWMAYLYLTPNIKQGQKKSHFSFKMGKAIPHSLKNLITMSKFSISEHWHQYKIKWNANDKNAFLFIIYNQILIFPQCCNVTVNVVARFWRCYWWLKSGCSVKGTFQDYKKRHEIISL